MKAKYLTYSILLICAVFIGCGSSEQTDNGNGNGDADITLCKADCGVVNEQTDVDEDLKVDEDPKADADEDVDLDEDDKSDEEANNGDDNADQEDNNDNGSADEGDDELASVEKSEAEISSYDLWKKKVVTSTYDTFYLPGANWRVVCEQPCGLTDDLLKKKVLGAGNAIEKLLELTSADALAKYTPIEINVASSSMCGDYAALLAENGYVNRYFSPKFPTPGSYMCLWEADDNKLILPLNDENAMKLEAQMVLIHEYSHIIFQGRVQTWPENFEDFVKAFAFYVSGVWDGNGLLSENFPKITDACHSVLQGYAGDVYNLCIKCGFQFDDIATLFQMIDAEKGTGSAISESKLKEIFDTITSHDSVSECGLDWLGN